MDFSKILAENKDIIVRECTTTIFEQCGQRYSRQSLAQLTKATIELVSANFSALVDDDFSKIDRFIEKITRLRLPSGFALSEIQQAFDIHRIVLVPILTRELTGPALTEALNRLNICLSYTIRKFSDYYQELHEKHIIEYAQRLEFEVAKRTKELSVSEAKYRMLVEEINDGYFVHQKGRMVFANPAFCVMHGYTMEEVIGRPYLDFIAPESAKTVDTMHKKRQKIRSVQDQYVYYRMHKDGRSFPTENKVKVIKYKNKPAIAGVCRDISERTKMEQRVREAENLAHIGQLTASLAHEIRNPLSSIKMSIQMALKTIDFDKNSLKTMEISAREIARLENILTEMLDFARPVSLNPDKVYIGEVIDSSISLLDYKIKEKNLTVKKKFLKRIPKILLDKEKMEQVIINILLNSIESLGEEGIIWITAKYKGNPKSDIILLFADNGPGISKEIVPYIFDPFFTKKKKGTGLGLANVKKVIEAHGGTVATVLLAEGFSLVITLPINKK